MIGLFGGTELFYRT